MLMFWNRKELMITTDLNRQADICNALADHHIDYQVKVRDLVGKSSLGIDWKYSYEYRIYVRRKDYEKAKWLIR